MKPKHVPMRSCVVCHTAHPKRELVRIVRTASDGVQLDERGKVSGRGAYLCHQSDCWQSALDNPNILRRALQSDLTAQEREQLKEKAEQFIHAGVTA